MEIGLLVSERSFTEELNDLAAAIKKAGHRPRNIHVDHMSVRLKGGKIETYESTGLHGDKKVDVDCAILRHLGVINDYEQFSQRVWSVKSFEMNGKYVSNNIKSWLIASDKLGALMHMSKKGIPVPYTISGEDFFTGYHAVQEMRSAVVKPLRSGAGVGIFKVDDPDVGMHIFSYFTNLSKPIYVQKFLQKKNGGDYRVIVVGGEVIGAEFRKGAGWKSNIAQGGKGVAAKPTSEMKELAIKAANSMNLDYVGVDIADTAEGYYVLETNPTISWGTFKQVTKVNPATHIVRNLIRKAKS